MWIKELKYSDNDTAFLLDIFNGKIWFYQTAYITNNFLHFWSRI